MFVVHLWDANAPEKLQSIKRVTTSVDISKVLLDLSYDKYPNLSQITFDDYELFNDRQLDQIIEEIEKLEALVDDTAKKNFLKNLLLLVNESRVSNLWILFDPFYAG